MLSIGRIRKFRDLRITIWDDSAVKLLNDEVTNLEEKPARWNTGSVRNMGFMVFTFKDQTLSLLS